MKGMLGAGMIQGSAYHPRWMLDHGTNRGVLYFIGECLKLIQNVQISPHRPVVICQVFMCEAEHSADSVPGY